MQQFMNDEFPLRSLNPPFDIIPVITLSKKIVVQLDEEIVDAVSSLVKQLECSLIELVPI